MELKEEYTLLFNAISEAIEEVEEAIRKSERLLLMLKKAQRDAEERYINQEGE